MKYVITIGRQYGSGGRYVAKTVANKLNIKCYDSELLLKIASEHGLDADIVKRYDEKSTLISNLYCSFVNDTSLQSRLIEAQFDTIQHIAQEESCVIVGRCADYILRDNKNLTSVFIMAPIEQRVQRAVRFYNLDPNKAEDIIKKTDKRRASYYSFYTDKKWGRADSYNLCIDSSIGIDATADLIVSYASQKDKLNQIIDNDQNEPTDKEEK